MSHLTAMTICRTGPFAGRDFPDWLYAESPFRLVSVFLNPLMNSLELGFGGFHNPVIGRKAMAPPAWRHTLCLLGTEIAPTSGFEVESPVAGMRAGDGRSLNRAVTGEEFEPAEEDSCKSSRSFSREPTGCIGGEDQNDAYSRKRSLEVSATRAVCTHLTGTGA